MFGGLISGPIADRWGRKTALMLGGVPYFIGYLTLSYAHYLPTALSFKALALTGRFLTGVGMGWACMAGPVGLLAYKSNICLHHTSIDCVYSVHDAPCHLSPLYRIAGLFRGAKFS